MHSPDPAVGSPLGVSPTRSLAQVPQKTNTKIFTEALFVTEKKEKKSENNLHLNKRQNKMNSYSREVFSAAVRMNEPDFHVSTCIISKPY